MKQELRKLLGSGKLVIGTERSLKTLAAGKAKKIILSANCSDSTKAKMETLAKTAGAELEVAKENNEELGVLCRKPFRIAVLCITQ